jgi:hypothetical protein
VHSVGYCSEERKRASALPDGVREYSCERVSESTSDLTAYFISNPAPREMVSIDTHFWKAHR